MRGGRPGVAALALLIQVLQAGSSAAQPTPAPAAERGATILLLDVKVNGWALGLVGRFVLDGDRLWISPEQFEGLGFILEPAYVTTAGSEQRVYLDKAPDLTWAIDQAAQAIDIRAPYARLKPQTLRINPGPARVQARSDWGAMLSYNLTGEWSLDEDDTMFGRSVAGDVAARLFGPRFTAETTAYFTPDRSPSGPVRLESWVDFQNQGASTNLRLGDSYTGAIGWSRALRFGGIQWQRDFGLRPDIVTEPMPQLSTGVAAPSTVDLYINGVERYASGVSPGALVLSDLPITTGANSVRMMVTDATGRERMVEMSFYSSTRLLTPGLTDFSFEAGAVRESFAIESNDYGDPFVSGTFRRGITPWLTGEFHAEANADLVLAGGTLVASIWDVATMAVATAYSDGPAGRGRTLGFYLERTGPVFSATLLYLDRSPDFQDLAVLADQPIARRSGQASMSLRFGDNKTLNATYLLQDRGPLGRSGVATATYTQTFFNNRLRVDVSGFQDFGQTGEWGAGLVVSFPLGRNTVATTGANTGPRASTYYVAADGDAYDGDLTWRGRYTGGDSEAADLGVIWRGRHVDLSVRGLQIEDSAALQLDIGQSLVLFDGRPFASSRIDDAFTLVDVEGSPGVEVFLENRSVGRTGKTGRLFVNDLRGYEANALSINPQDLSLSAEADTFAATVAPRTGGGVITRFAVDHRRAAVVVLRRPDGSTPPVGATATLDAGGEAAMLGYGGEVYLRGIAPGANAVTVRWPDHSCRATFQAPTTGASLPRIEATSCQ